MSPVPVDNAPLANGNLADATEVEAKFDVLFNYFTGNADRDIFKAAANILASHMDSSFLEKIGVSGASTVRRGVTAIAAEEVRSNTAYGLMSTADRVQNVVLPTNGLILVDYFALWKNSVASAGSAAVFLGANQVKLSQSGAPVVGGAEGGGNSFPNAYVPLYTAGHKLSGHADNEHGAPVTTGQVFGAAAGGAPGTMEIFAAAGTYDVSIQFKSSSGSVSVKNRTLRVEAIGF